MKVLYLIDTLNSGGAEKSLLDILTSCQKIDPVLCKIYEGDRLLPLFQEKGIPVISLNLQAKYGFGSAFNRVLAIMDKERPDLIHATLARSNFIGRCATRWRHLPLVSSLVSDSYGSSRMNSIAPGLRRKLKIVRQIDQLTSRWVNHFVANSETVKNSYCSGFHIPPEKVTVIYRGRDPVRFESVSDSEVTKLRSSFGVTPGSPILLNVSRLVPLKGHEELIRAFQLVKSQFPEALLLIAGEGPSRTSLETLIADLDLLQSVRLLGHREDIPVLLKACNVFVFPSYYEGHPGSLVEAMMARCAIVASDIPVHRETLVQHETGIMVPLKSEQALAEEIIRLLKEPYEARRIGRDASLSARNRFHVNKMAMLHEELYSNLIFDRSRASK